MIVTREILIKYLRKECYFFEDGEEMFQSALKQMKQRRLFIEGSERSLESFFGRCIDLCLRWRDTIEGSHYWNRRKIKVNDYIESNGIANFPNRAKKLFIEIKED